MDKLKAELKKLPTIRVGEHSYISHQTAVNTTAVFLFPDHTPEQIDAVEYKHTPQTADTACREMGKYAIRPFSHYSRELSITDGKSRLIFMVSLSRDVNFRAYHVFTPRCTNRDDYLR